MIAESAVIWTRELSAIGYVGYRLEHQGRASASVVVDVLDSVPDWERLRSDLDRASRLVLRMRQRVVAPLLPITPARWVIDPDFDLDYHMRRIALPGPGSFRQLLDLAETFHSAPLDVNRPLWEATLVEGLCDQESPAAAIIWKFSHAVTDGIGGIVFDRVLRAGGREPQASPMPLLPSPEDLSPLDLTRRELRHLPLMAAGRARRRTSEAVHLVTGTTRDPVGAVKELGRFVSSLRRAAGGPPAPPSPLLQRRGLQRRVESFEIDFSELRAAASNAGCSLNDAYVAAVCGGLRLYHEQLGVPVDAIPVAISIPIEADDRPALNPWSGVRVAAPISEIDPVVRMRKVREIVLTAEERAAEAALLRAAAPVVAWLPDQVLAAARDAGDVVDVNVGHLSGHVGPVHVAGAPVVRIVPIGPLAGAAATILSYTAEGRCHIGVHLDAVAVAEPAVFVESLRQGSEEVIGVAQRPARGRSR